MSLATNLTNSEVLDDASAEVEFNRVSTSGRQLIFASSGETPNLPHRMTLSHQEIGSGVTKRRRSVVRLDLNIDGEVDTDRVATISAYTVIDIPVGNVISYAEATTALAELVSFLSTAAGGATLAIDGSAPGSAALINGSL